MPIYEFACEKCKTTFTQVMSVRELEARQVKCPNCGSTEVRQVISAPHTVTSKKS